MSAQPAQPAAAAGRIRRTERVWSVTIIAVATVLIAGIVVALLAVGPKFWLKSADSVLPHAITGFEQSGGGPRDRVYLGESGGWRSR